MLWYQALQENGDEQCQLIYSCIIPGFPNPVDLFDWGKSLLSHADAEELIRDIRGPDTEDDGVPSNVFYHSGEKDTEGTLSSQLSRTDTFIFDHDYGVWLVSFWIHNADCKIFSNSCGKQKDSHKIWLDSYFVISCQSLTYS